ncbi:MAG: carboxypeptidase-like regulatory domain-containing protein [Bacteroidetes bacterium]|nr:carboxypeptidase-like regulatory domain-containing protein [Bacteroidota bacterium]
MMLRKLILSLIGVLAISASFAQEKVKWQDDGSKARKLVQFTGIVVEGDSLKPVPYTSIIIKNTNRGTISDYFGYFSFVAQESDTLQFSAIGYANASFIIPDTLTTNKYSLIQVLRTDTVYLQTTEVYPWPTKEQFKQAFLKLEMPEDDLDRASRNMARADMKERMTGMAMDASLNYKYSMQQYQSKLYYAGQLPPNTLLNPIAWAKFIQAWKRGDYKKKN